MLANDVVVGFALALIPALLVSVLTALVTVRLSLRQFYSQKWWELKAETYTNIVGELSRMAESLDGYLDHEMTGRPSGEALDALGAQLSEARKSMVRQAHQGALVVSPEVASELEALVRELDESANERTLFEQVDRDAAAVRRAIERVIPIAQKDLKSQS